LLFLLFLLSLSLSLSFSLSLPYSLITATLAFSSSPPYSPSPLHRTSLLSSLPALSLIHIPSSPSDSPLLSDHQQLPPPDPPHRLHSFAHI
ncbi:hypothetical protein BKA57DRAFT_429952, partial [Linnemannia elongata]